MDRLQRRRMKRIAAYIDANAPMLLANDNPTPAEEAAGATWILSDPKIQTMFRHCPALSKQIRELKAIARTALTLSQT